MLNVTPIVLGRWLGPDSLDRRALPDGAAGATALVAGVSAFLSAALMRN